MCHASAFLVISAGAGMTEESFKCFDDTDPAFFGKDYIQRPLMVAIGGNDFIADNTENHKLPSEEGFDPSKTDWMFPVTNAVGLNNAPAYGVVIDGANHFTPISEFHGMASWDFGTFWDWFGGVLTVFDGLKSINLDKQACTEDDDELLQGNSVADTVIDFLEGMFPQLPVTADTEEKDRLGAFEEYTRDFWDVYLTPEYDAANSGYEKGFLQESDQLHMDETAVMGIYGFRHSAPGAFVIRDSSGKDLVQFQNDGRLLMLKGDVFTGQNITQTAAEEFVIRNVSGTIAAKIDSTTGNLYLKGTVTDSDTISDLRTTSAPEFVIRDAVEIAQEGNADKAKIIIDTNGNLKLTGKKLVRHGSQQ